AFLAFLGFIGTIGLCKLFGVNFFNFDPAYYAVADVPSIFLTLKFWMMHILLAFPLIAALLLYYGRLRFVLLLSMVFQVIAILFTKSRGGGIAMAVIFLIMLAYFIWESRRNSEVLRR